MASAKVSQFTIAVHMCGHFRKATTAVENDSITHAAESKEN